MTLLESLTAAGTERMGAHAAKRPTCSRDVTNGWRCPAVQEQIALRRDHCLLEGDEMEGADAGCRRLPRYGRKRPRWATTTTTMARMTDSVCLLCLLRTLSLRFFHFKFRTISQHVHLLGSPHLIGDGHRI